MTPRRQGRLPRTIVLDMVRQMRAWTVDLLRIWACPSTVYDTEAMSLRGRRLDEYPENSPDRWLALHHYAKAMETEARRLADFAKRQEKLTRERGHNNAPQK